MAATPVGGDQRGSEAGSRGEHLENHWKAAMGSARAQITLHEPAICVVRVRGALSSDWSDRLGGMHISVVRAGRHTITELAGQLADQAALQGVLATLYELGLPLLSVDCAPAQRPRP